MPASDKKRMADFYSEAFGWESRFLGEEMGNYVTVSTAETDDNGMILQPGAINGGFYQRSADMPSNCPSLVIAVEDIKEHINIVNKAGGQVLTEPMDIPGVGTFASFRDTEGNVCSILQPLMTSGFSASQNENAEVEEFGMTGEI